MRGKIPSVLSQQAAHCVPVTGEAPGSGGRVAGVSVPGKMVCCTIGCGAATVTDIFSTYGFGCRDEEAGRAGCDAGLRAGVAARFLEALGRADFLAGLFGRDAFLTLRLAAAFLAGRFFFAADFLAGLAAFFFSG